MEPRGVVVAGDREHPLRHALTIGRDSENHIALDDSTVSRRHAILVYVENRWLVEDRGSANGTFVNGLRVPYGSPHPLRHGDRIAVGSATLVFSWPADRDDPDRTDSHDQVPALVAALSPFQQQVVKALCGAWVTDESVDVLPSNEQIAAALGTPEAVGSVKAALRRVYAKAGLSDMLPHAKRRALCRAARAQGWL
ncbi:MAG: FHA domain-containing protein [Actinobacteria bacterium]|nr:FHA domain-containing protein [Actinomycetota bacterium]